jgi:hypothetical protein
MTKPTVLHWVVALWLNGFPVGISFARSNMILLAIALVMSAISFYAIKRFGEKT